MFGTEFYNETTRRYVAVFGTLFNDIIISRKNNSGTTVQRMKVPVNYGPMQKFLSRLEQDPDLRAPAMTLPRITFEIMSIAYDPERRLTTQQRFSKNKVSDDAQFNTRFSPAPYNLEFQLNIMSKYQEDGTKILEQILPFFRPEFTPTVKLLDDQEIYLDTPIILTSISAEDTYEGTYEERRALIWTLSFTLKGYYFGPNIDKKIIKFAQTNVYSSLDATQYEQAVKVQPGLTANGNPTTDITQTVNYLNINEGDDWAYIVQIEDYSE